MSQTGAMLSRHMGREVQAALADTRVVLIHGARQVGKSTLAAISIADRPDALAVSLDDPPTVDAARADPVGFVQQAAGTLLIDEVQRAPHLLLAIKAEVDRDQRPGRFLLTGSAQVLALPMVADALAGRIEPIELWPFSQGEMRGQRDDFVATLFTGSLAAYQSTLRKTDYVELAATGGFPEIVRRSSPARRRRWFDSYLQTFVQRDIRDIADLERLSDIPRLLRMIAARSANVVNVEALARDSGLAGPTFRRYLNMLELTFLVQRVPAWSTNWTSRATHAPKVYISDSGLLAHLLGVNVASLGAPGGAAGPVLETFVAMELRRQLGWSDQPASLYHFRTKDGVEVDCVLEAPDGRVAAVEVKAAATVTERDFRGLRLLRDSLGAKFVAGVVLYCGAQALPFGERLRALPMSALWEA
ncbi:MAG TPA: ATP-binding protein [Candidatus Dormibacteraeota bacterium]|nr:ATP-binding protein [Candidatus Dormibacteraeota bacterium]